MGTVTSELEGIDLALARLRRDLESLKESGRVTGPRWRTTRAAIGQAILQIGIAGARVREAAEFVPDSLDFDA